MADHQSWAPRRSARAGGRRVNLTIVATTAVLAAFCGLRHGAGGSASAPATAVFASGAVPAGSSAAVSVSRSEALRGFAASAAAPLAILGTSGLPVAWADEEPQPSKWSGNYNDPKHKYCTRAIYVAFNGKKAKISGSDVSEGTSCNKVGEFQYKWETIATLASKDSDELVIEPSTRSITTREKRNDGGKFDSVVAKWDGDGILFPDGTKWTKKTNRGRS
mmetsp:Transcript_119489/g.338149  ORF Transcript_119489/g.338149 Transcript_119489/m.338149 type:complete len:220 (+) Transcript_119489:69-728(+)